MNDATPARLPENGAAEAIPRPARWVIREPRQAWAHADGLMSLRPNQPVTPGQVLDRLMIHEAFARWGIAWDEGCLEVVRSVFVDNGKLVIVEGSATPIVTLVGHDEIVAHVSKTRDVQADQRRHAMSNIVIEELTPTRAVALAYGLVTMIKGDMIHMGATVFYKGELLRDDAAGWRFETFIIGMDGYARREG